MLIPLLNFGVMALLAFLFAAVASTRLERRVLIWAVGWALILTHDVIGLWTPAGFAQLSIKLFFEVDLFVLCGAAFLFSSMHPRHQRRELLFALIAILANSVPIALAVFASRHPLLLSASIFARAVVILIAVWITRSFRWKRPKTDLLISALVLFASAWMTWAAFTRRWDVFFYALMAEIFLASAIGFWGQDRRRSLGLKTICCGFAAEAVLPLVFFAPGAEAIDWAQPIFWLLPKLGSAVGMILFVLEKGAAKSQAISEEYRLIFENNPQPLWVIDRSTLRFLAANQAAIDAHGYTREEFLRLTLDRVVDPQSCAEVKGAIDNMRLFSGRCTRHRRKDGSSFYLEIRAYNIDFRGRSCRMVLGVDVSEREALAEQLAHQMGHDSLTGLANRSLFLDKLESSVERSVESGELLAVLCIDLIRLKNINDTYGMKVGDICILRVASMLKQRIRSSDLAARVGGDEFALAIGGLHSAADAEQIALSIRELFAAPIVVEGYKIQLPVSMGMAVCPSDGDSGDTLWRRAESARQRSRTATGGELVWASPELSRAAEEEIELEAFLREQLESGGFHLAYQPIFNFVGKLCSMEALARLTHPKLGPISPARFIPLAEESGMILPLGRWLLEEVCRQLNQWKALGAQLVPVAVNVSSLQVMRLDFASQVLDTLRRFDVSPQLIHLEITESAAMQSSSELFERIHVLAREGVKFSIDDFGAGHSSLERLHLLPLSTLKIDRSFVDRLGQRGGAFSIVQAILSMAHALGLKVIAEGVETSEQLALLRTLRCDLLQGYLLSRPLAPEQIPELIRAGLPSLPGLAGGVPTSSPVCRESSRKRERFHPDARPRNRGI